MGNTRKKVIATIQMRMGSKRLVGKSLMTIAGKTGAEWIKYRLSFCTELDGIVMSIPDDAENDPLEQLAKDLELPYYRGSESDLVSRTVGAARAFDADAIVRVTGDCPLVDPAIVDDLISTYRAGSDTIDHVTNVFPPTFPDGMDVEVMPRETLEKLDAEIKDPLYREWLTTTIMENPDTYTIANRPLEENLSYLRVTVDYQEDLDLVEKIFEELHNEGGVFHLKDIVDLLRARPDLVAINKMRVDEGILNNIRSAEFHALKEESTQ